MPLVDALATEVLSEITGYLSASDISTLYAVGSRNLGIKLSRDGVAFLGLSWTQTGWIPWPQSLFERHTSIRSLEWSSGRVPTLCKDANLSFLSSNLESLSLDFLDSFYLIERTNASLSDLFPRLHTLRLKGACVTENALYKVPNTLTRLEIDSSGSILRSSRFLTGFPAQLKVLKLGFEIRAEPPTDMPRYIESLELRITSRGDWTHILPPTLTHLLISANHDAIQVESLPKTLTKVVAEWPLELSASALASLPPNLKTLHGWFEEYPSERLVASLPESLTEIRSFSGCGSLQRRKFDNFIPSSNQTSLYAPTIVMCMPEDGTMNRKCDCSNELGNPFSPFLTLLVVSYLDSTIASWLPPTLTELRFQDGHLTEIGASHLSKTRLRKIEAPFDSFANESALGLIYNMKSVTLRLKHCHKLTSKWLESILKNVGFPPSSPNSGASAKEIDSPLIEELNLRFPKYEAGDSFYFSSNKKSPLLLGDSFLNALSQLENLTKLDIELGFVPLPKDLWSRMPKQVKMLSLSNLATLPHQYQLHQLPKGLLDLFLSVSKPDTWNEGEFEALPKGLRRIELQGLNTMPALTRSKLSPHLSNLTINGRPLVQNHQHVN